MKLYILLTILVTSTTADRRCLGVYFGDKYYDVQILKEGVNRIHHLIVNRNDNTLYFIFEQISTVPERSLGYYNIETQASGAIDGIRNATAIAIDQKYNNVYVGGSDGVFTINDKVPTRFPIRDSVQSLYFKDVLFYTNRRKEAFIYENGHINPVFELQGVRADKLVLDDDNNIFFTEDKTLFRVKLGTRAVNTHERFNVDVLTTDSYNRAYVCTKEAVYVYNKYKYVLDRVSTMPNLRALTFGKGDEPYYAVLDKLLKLRLNEVACFEEK